jgi:hypothetical protein
LKLNLFLKNERSAISTPPDYCWVRFIETVWIVWKNIKSKHVLCYCFVIITWNTKEESNLDFYFGRFWYLLYCKPQREKGLLVLLNTSAFFKNPFNRDWKAICFSGFSEKVLSKMWGSEWMKCWSVRFNSWSNIMLTIWLFGHPKFNSINLLIDQLSVTISIFKWHINWSTVENQFKHRTLILQTIDTLFHSSKHVNWN